MLTSNEEKYLSKIPEEKIVQIQPYDPRTVDTVDSIRNKLRLLNLDHDIRWIGASALGLAGQNDIDLHILSDPIEWENLSEKVTKIFGRRVQGISIYKWEFKTNGFDVELYLSDPENEGMKSQLQVFEILRSSKRLSGEYENMKLGFDGKSFRDYMRAKYEFYHKVLEK